jgi:hypothetical protein
LAVPFCLSGEHSCLLSADSRNGNRAHHARLSFSIRKLVIYTRLFWQGRRTSSRAWRVFADIPPLPHGPGVIQHTVIEVSV